MRQIVYSMRFTGHAAPVAGSTTVLKAATTASSNSLTTKIATEGLTAIMQPIEGDKAYFESEVTFTSETTFNESGSIRFGEGNHRLSFITIGQGYLGDSVDPKLKHGSVIWRIDGGDGQFAQATGLITSNFTVSDTGEVSDNHFGLIFL